MRRETSSKETIGQLLVLLEIEADGTRLFHIGGLVCMCAMNGIFDLDSKAFCLRRNIIIFVQSKNTRLDGDWYG